MRVFTYELAVCNRFFIHREYNLTCIREHIPAVLSIQIFIHNKTNILRIKCERQSVTELKRIITKLGIHVSYLPE